MNIIGQSQTGTTIDGTNNGRVMTIIPGIKVGIKSLTIQKGNVTGDIVNFGGGIFNNGILILNDCTIQNNTVMDGQANVGGGIYNERKAHLTLINCIIKDNIALGLWTFGGGICNQEEGTIIMDNCTLKNNQAIGLTNQGGGIFNDGNMTITNSHIESNFAGGGTNLGGGINNQGNMTLTKSNLINNDLKGNSNLGGGIANQEGGNTTANLNRIVGNTNPTIFKDKGNVNAEKNWWGTNHPDFKSLLLGMENPKVWIYMTIKADPAAIHPGETSTIIVSFNQIYNGTTITPLTGHIPDNTLVNFTSSLGEIGKIAHTIQGRAKTILKTSTTGIAIITAQTDQQILSTRVKINPKEDTNTSSHAQGTVGMENTGTEIMPIFLSIILIISGIFMNKD